MLQRLAAFRVGRFGAAGVQSGSLLWPWRWWLRLAWRRVWWPLRWVPWALAGLLALALLALAVWLLGSSAWLWLVGAVLVTRRR